MDRKLSLILALLTISSLIVSSWSEISGGKKIPLGRDDELSARSLSNFILKQEANNSWKPTIHGQVNNSMNESLTISNSNSKQQFHIQVTAIHVDKAEFLLSKLLFKLTLKLALSVAEKRLESKRVKLSISFRSASTCSGQFANAIAAEEYYLKKSRLFIVSGCDDAIRGVSRLASNWNVPVMTAAGFGADLNDKSVYKTLIRIAFSLKTAVKFLTKLLKSFSWHRVNLIVDESDTNSLAIKNSIVKHLDHQLKSSEFQIILNTIPLDLQFLINLPGSTASNSTLSSTPSNTSKPLIIRSNHHDDNWPNELTERAVSDALRQSSFFSRVNILLIPQQYLRKFMLSVYDNNMANGLYTFINIPLLLATSGDDQLDSTESNSNNANYTKQSYTSSTGENVFLWRSLTSTRNSQAKQAFESLMSIFLKNPATKAYIYFASKLLNLANLDYATTTTQSTLIAKNNSFQLRDKIQLNINPYSAAFYDCLQIYTSALEESLSLFERQLFNSTNFIHNRRRINDSLHTKIVGQLKNRRFDNMITGSISINELGDREADYTLDDLNPMTGKFGPVVLFRGESKEIERIGRIHWSSDESVGQTIDNVDCRLIGTCASKPYSKFVLTFLLALVPTGSVLCLIFYFVYNRINLESQLVDYWWKISYKELEMVETRRKTAGENSSIVTSSSQVSAESLVKQQLVKGQSGSNSRKKSQGSEVSDGDPSGIVDRTGTTTIKSISKLTETTSAFRSTAIDVCYGKICLGLYKLNKVALKPIGKFHQSRKLMIELRMMKTIQHNNLCRFVGIVTDCNDDSLGTLLVSEFCPRGSLREFFQNESMVIDWTFKYSIINDIMAGLTYLHSSQLEFHGRLKSSNCLVSSRFIVKLSDYGLRSLNDAQLNLDSSFSSMIDPDDSHDSLEMVAKNLWFAPEHLKSNKNSLAGSTKGDVYSLGLLLYEIITNKIPFKNLEQTDYKMPLKQLLQELKSNGISELTGPDLNLIDLNQNPDLIVLLELMKKCWQYDANKRPTLQVTNSILRRITKGVTSKKLLENLTSRMEQYTNNLESLVEAKLATLIEEKSKTEELLYQFVPKSIASLLKEGQTVSPEAFDCVTVFYSDIVGFTSLSSESSPIEVIDFLSDLYLCFDEILEHYDIFKVDTIGDAYIVASGLPKRNDGRHVIEIANAAFELRARIAAFKIPHKPNRSLQMRVGINSGPCIAGIVGGTNMPKYCVFGDTLSIGKFMEFSGLPMKIHITEESKVLLDKVGGFKIEPRLPKICKDGLPLQTYWLENEQSKETE